MQFSGTKLSIRCLAVTAACLYLGAASQAKAGTISASYFYDYQTTIADATCTDTGDDGTRNEFASVSGSNSVSSSDGVTFSICHGSPGLDGGEFTIGSAGNVATGIFSGTYVGVSTDTGLLPDGGTLDGGALFTGTFTIESATGNYAPYLGDSGTLQVNTGAPDANSDQNNGLFTVTPEPVSLLLAGSGLMLFGLAKLAKKLRLLAACPAPSRPR